jgi:hypothetical protein
MLVKLPVMRAALLVILAAAGVAMMPAAIVGPAVAQVVSAEDEYIAARDAAIARFTPDKVPTVDQPVLDDEARQRADLERRMRAIVGPPPQGFDRSALNLGSLFKDDQGFGTLDGLRFTANGGAITMIVTTRMLLMRWLRAHENWWKDERLPQQPDETFRTEPFYTQALETDAAVVMFAEIPLAGAARPAFAMLAGRTQSEMPDAADEVIVAAVKGERAFVAHAVLEPKLAIAACSRQRSDAEKKAEQMQGGDPAAADALREQAEIEFQRCFAARAPQAAGFAAAARLAKALYERMR